MAQETHVTSPLLGKIRERGYWRVVIRPGRFEQSRIPNISSLYPLLQERVVRLRGWYFPHLEEDGRYRTGLDWIEEASEYTYHLEYWRFYQSGQFVDYAGLFEDWGMLDEYFDLQPVPDGHQVGQRLAITNTVYRFTEIFEFAARLALTDAYRGDERIHLAVLLRGLRNRRLFEDEPRFSWRRNDRPATIEEFPYVVDLASVELIANAHQLALQAAEQLFHRFQWQPAPGVLQTIQDELLRR